MNEAGATEIVEIEDAVQFCRRLSLQLLFESSAPSYASGSLPILVASWPLKHLREAVVRVLRTGVEIVTVQITSIAE